jgi:Domain of unknown function (DUF4348)
MTIIHENARFNVYRDMSFFRIFLTALCLVALFAACRQSTKAQIMASTTTTDGQQPTEDFMLFYERFHRDSLFQMAHISFPLAGASLTQRDTTEEARTLPTTWNREGWRMQRLELLQKPQEFIREWRILDSIMVIERIRWREANYIVERRFAKESTNSWMLIYYADVLEMTPIR